MQKQQTSTHLNEALAKRPDREQLEQQHILAPAAATPAPASAAVAATAKPVRLLSSVLFAIRTSLSLACVTFSAIPCFKIVLTASKAASGGGVTAAPSAAAAKREDPKKKGIGGIFGFGKKKESTPLSTSNPQTTFLTGSAPPPTGGTWKLNN